MSVAALLDGKDICICAGAGGVGKTTTSAAIGVGMARRGLKVVVLTIDPARRLANSLGLPELGNEECQIELDAPGELWAMMLDAKTTFDEIVDKHAPDAETRDAVLSNRIYKELSTAVAGSQEYMAMEKLHELHDEGRYDLLVLDTPPSRNALDFLDAPDRLSRFIDSRSLQFFLAPSRTGLKIFSRGTGMLFSVLKRITGVDLLQDLSDFFASFGDMASGFRDRAKAVKALLADDRTTFLLVTSAAHEAVEEAKFFRDKLEESGMPFGAVIVNRMHVEEPGEQEDLDSLDPKLAEKVAANFKDFHTLAERDRRNVEQLTGDMGERPLIVVPYLDGDIHDLEGIEAINEHLFAGEAVVQTGAE
ncbi:MAG: ArsA family ATPase [Thermoleophilaceae bacterium]